MEATQVCKKTKVLVVDDERPITLLLACILERKGYEVATAYNGSEAVCTACSFHPDCLLTDIDMPMMNGVDAAIEIVSACPACKVLFVSGHVSCSELMEHARAMGYDFEVLNKPVVPTELLKRVSELLACNAEGKCQ